MHQVLKSLRAQSVEQHVGQKEITAIVPIRVNNNSTFRLSRLDFIRQDPTAMHYADVLIVDDGSPLPWSEQIAEICARNAYRYERLDTVNKLFSIGRARNHGAQIASTQFVFYMDVDLLPPAGFFRKLDEEVKVRKLSERGEDMIMVPYAFLTEAATEDYLKNGGVERFGEFLDNVIERNPAVLEKFSTGTPACIYTRLYYLARGGNIDEFSGWGFEDLEFNLRMARLSQIFPIPADYSIDKSNFDLQFEYRGWKSFYRLFGDRSFLKGLLLFHAWHPVDQHSAYYKQRHANKTIFARKVADFVKEGVEPEPLPCANSGRTLVLKKTPFTYSRALRPMLGQVVFGSPESLPNEASLGAMLASRRIDRIVFHNPYATQETQRIYKWARENAFPFVVCERGALNGSIFFDRTGFLADSTLFDEAHWRHPLSSEEQCRLDDYIMESTSTSDALEAQGPRLPPAELRERIGVTTADHVVLVSLQRPGDTATRFFPGPLGNYGDFVWTLEKLSMALPHNVKLAFKVHPLEDYAPDIKGINVSQYHINDLMGIANKVVTFNSGTGVVAMLWNLPVVVCGKAFYGHDALTYGASNDGELRDLICAPLSNDEEARRQFLHYLRFSYYSFGRFATRQVNMADGSRMTATIDINFHVIRSLGHSELRFANRSAPQDSWRSMLFDRYQGTRDKVKGSKPPNLFQSDSTKAPKLPLAKRIYKSSRAVPIYRQVVDVFVPLYDRIFPKR